MPDKPVIMPARHDLQPEGGHKVELLLDNMIKMDWIITYFLKIHRPDN